METSYWCFNQLGEAGAVMRKERQALPKPGPGQAIVKIHAVGLNQSENRYLLGTHFSPTTFPACISYEAVGKIVELGSRTDVNKYGRNWNVGDRVTFIPMLVDLPGMGVLREYGLYDQSCLLPVPEQYSDTEGAAYWMAIMTMGGALDMAGFGPQNSQGKTIAFTAAAGGMGTVAAQLVRGWGARSIITTRRQNKIKQLANIASDAIVVTSPAELETALLEFNSEGVDAIIDPLGGEYVGAAVSCLAHRGQFVSYERVAGELGTFDIMRLLMSDASLHGYTTFRPVTDADLLNSLIEIGLRDASGIKPVLAEVFNYDIAPQAFEALKRSQHVGKIVIAV